MPRADSLPLSRVAALSSSARGRAMGADLSGRARSEAHATVRWLENRDRGFSRSWWRRAHCAFARRFNRLNAPVVYPWSPSCDGAGSAHELHRAAAELLGGRARGFGGHAWLVVKAVVWPALATAATLPLLYRCGQFVRERHGLRLRDQWRDLLHAAWRHGIFPAEYYQHGVFRGPARRDPAVYLREREMMALLSAASRGADAPRVDQPRRLFAECRASAVPAPRVVAAFLDGKAESGDELAPSALPQKDLFLRPEKWRPAETGEIWRWNAQARNWDCRGEALDAPALIQRCRKLSAARPMLLLECLHNHPELARFSVSGLCTVRIASGVDAHGEPRLLFAALHMPANEPGCALSAGVDVRSGRLSAATGELLTDGEFDTHPATGAIITDSALPHWSALTDLVLRAHRHFHDVPFVGWEVALAGSGPVLVEASTNWGVFPHALPAESEFAAMCLQRLEAIRRSDLRVHPLTRPVRDAAPESTSGALPSAAAGETPRS